MDLDEYTEIKGVLVAFVRERGGSCTIRYLQAVCGNLKVSMESNSPKTETKSSIYLGLRFGDIHRTPPELQGCIRSVYR
jgi:hypothetical protein